MPVRARCCLQREGSRCRHKTRALRATVSQCDPRQARRYNWRALEPLLLLPVAHSVQERPRSLGSRRHRARRACSQPHWTRHTKRSRRGTSTLRSCTYRLVGQRTDRSTELHYQASPVAAHRRSHGVAQVGNSATPLLALATPGELPPRTGAEIQAAFQGLGRKNL
jgi:hypothetical protein